MKILLVGGGTAGHINPAIAIAQYFRENLANAEIVFAGTPNGMEVGLVKKAGFDFVPINVMGISRGFTPSDIVHNIEAVTTVIKARFAAKRILLDIKPDVVIGTGGYVSGPIVLMAAKMKIKTYIHEQNAFPGVTTKVLAPKVNTVFLAVKESAKYLPSGIHSIIVGNPIRASVLEKSKAEARKELGMDKKFCILSFGGSLGADTINKLVADIMEWHFESQTVNHIHGYGRLGKEKFPQLMYDKGIDIASNPYITAKEYIDNMDTCLAACDLVICRAGALTISELQATGKPSVLVPSPNVTANHQYHNALVLANKKACVLLEEKDYTKEKIISIVRKLYDDPLSLKQLSINVSNMAILDTAKRIFDEIMSSSIKK